MSLRTSTHRRHSGQLGDLTRDLCVLDYGIYDVRLVIVRLVDVGLVDVGLVPVDVRLGFVD